MIQQNATRLVGLITVALCGLAFAAKAQPTGDAASQIASTYATSTIFLAIQGVTVDGQSETRYGTGFIISDDGYVITVSHNVVDSKRRPYSKLVLRGSLGVSFDPQSPTGLIFPLESVKLNIDVDVALLKLPSVQKYNFVHFCREVRLAVGARINALGFPLGMPLSVNSGALSSKDGPRGLWKTDILVNEGSSGGPVFDNSGHVIGVVKGGIQEAPGNNFIIPTNLMSDMLQSGLSVSDDCSESPQAAELSDCKPKAVEYNIDITKSDHPGLAQDSRTFSQTFRADPGSTIENYVWVPLSSSKASEPEITVSQDKSTLRFSTSISSGPFFDQWRGWQNGKIITTQKPKC
jgi:S1-C subfamily serine protease